MSHAMVTAAIPFAAAQADAVNRYLDDCARGLRDSMHAFRKAMHGSPVHFLSLTVVPPEGKGVAHLLVEISADGGPKDAYQAVAQRLKDVFDEVFRRAGIQLGAENLAAFLMRRDVKIGQGLFDNPGLAFPGTPGMTVQRIRSEYDLARAIRDYLDANPPGPSALDTLQAVRAHLRATRKFDALLDCADPIPKGDGAEKVFDAGFIASLLARGLVKFFWPVLLVLAVLVALATGYAGAESGAVSAVLTLLVSVVAAAVVLACVLAGIYLALRRMEKRAAPRDAPADAAVMDEITAHEDWAQHNHLAGISILHPGLVRRLTLRFALWVIGEMVAKRFRPGYLSDLGTIHFARWVQLPGTRQLLFFSNYGGSWQSYLEDFITRASFGLTGVWSNTVDFPRARNLFMDGAVDGERFKRWARRQQHPTRFWYSAYPHLTTARIRANAAVRQGLCNASTEDEADAWLRLLGSRVQPADLLETTEMQTLLFGGLRHHPYAACLVLRLPGDEAAARNWLAEVRPQITFGDQPPADKVTILALSMPGLEKLGVAEELRAQFPTAYRTGMACRDRASLLGDTGDDKPETWLWGRPGEEADAALLVYAARPELLDRAVADLDAQAARFGGAIVHKVTPTPMAGQGTGRVEKRQVDREPFGFADGVSQPIIRGTRRWLQEADKMHTVEPGEFILGYPDGRGYYPPSPQLAASADPQNRLPLADQSHIRTGLFPYFDGQGKGRTRDFGRNGTFIVIRQLEQDVEAFNGYLADAAARLAHHPAVPQRLTDDERAEWIGAKMVGRWRNGTSLVRYPNRPGGPEARPDNAFLFGAEDPLGQRCPLGSHIRRSNPRDSQAPGSPDELGIVNRHRILRVGRGFEASGSGDPQSDKPGLLFMCLNGDIERQFEFVQQTWSMNRQFHGLENEVDPILGRGGKMGRLSIPSVNGPLHLTGMKDFVRMRGGGYFFMPSRRAVRWMAEAR